MELSQEVVGLDDAVRALEGVDARTSVRIVRSSLRFAAKPTIDRAKQLVPYSNNSDGDSYSLRHSIGVRAESKKNRKGNATVMRFGAHRESVANDPNGYKILGGLNKSAKSPNYASLINDETPFLLPALEQTQDELLKRFGERILKAVKKL